MGKRVDSQIAVSIMRKAGLEPIEPYVNSKSPWPCVHEKCGRVVTPTYNAIQRGQGGCGYCAGVRLDSSDAEAFIRARGFEPLDAYPGNKRRWRVLHLACNEIAEIRFNTLQQSSTSGCRKCSYVFKDIEERVQFFQSRDFEPLEPYPGSNRPWKSLHKICGNVVQPRFTHIKSGRIGCPHCSKSVRITQESAVKLFQNAGLEPLEEFKGPHVPWRSIHVTCGREVSPRYANVQQGHSGCLYCAGLFVDPVEAVGLFESYGLIPLVPYPGNKEPWKSRHLACGKIVSPTYNSVSRGQGGCKYCGGHYIDPDIARKELENLGFEPLEEYQPRKKWLVRHQKCGRTLKINFSYTKKNGGGCSFCAGLMPITKSQALEIFEKAGFTLIGSFTKASERVRAIHNVCGREVEILYGSIRSGVGCKFCQVGALNLTKPAFLYLMSNESLEAHKIGIGGLESKTNRIDQHTKHGWRLYKKLHFKTAEYAYFVEQQVLRWIRQELGLPQQVLALEMPQGGHTETFPSAEIDLATVWKHLIEVSSRSGK